MGSQARRLRKQAGISGERYQAEQRRAAREAEYRLRGAEVAAPLSRAAAEEMKANMPGDRVLGEPFGAEAIDLKIDGKSVPQMAEPETPAAPAAPPAPGMRTRGLRSLLPLLALAAMAGVEPPKGSR